MGIAKLELTGDKKLDRALAALGGKTAKNIVRKGIRKAGAIALKAAKKNAASLERGGGEMLKLSRTLKMVALKRNKKGNFGVQIATAEKTVLGIPESSKWYWPAHVELGSSKRPALPYLRPAFDANKVAMLNAFRDKLWAEVKVMWQRGH